MLLETSILKLKQKLKDLGLDLDRLTPRQRLYAWIGGGVVLLLLAYAVIISPLVSLKNAWALELAQKQRKLQHYQDLRAAKAKVAQTHKTIKSTIGQIDSQMLTGDNAAVAAADLQEILKSLAGAHGAQITSTKAMQVHETGPYLEVPVQVQLSGGLRQIMSIIYQLEHHQKLLYVSELEINSPRLVRMKEALPLRVDLVVVGLIRKGKSS
jgi:type II secretory pathway component PulM